MPEGDRFAALLESLADGTPIDWAAAESATTSDDDRAWLQQLRRLELAVAQQKRSPGRGATWSHLQLIERIGAGAFGEVYRAHDPRLARDVALKLLYEPMLADDARASAVIEEGRLLARVRHPNVVTVYGAECRDGQVGIWTEFIDGQTLQAIVTDRGPLPAAEVTAIGIDLCRALAAVHDAGLLHRDIKAQNVMREAGGRIVLMDFGTGRDLDPMPGQKTDVSGTPLYLAPELFAGGEASLASDIYALGVLLYSLLTGKYPVSGSTLGEVRDGHLVGNAVSLGDVQPDVSSALADAIDRALSREPARRFVSAREFERALIAAQPAARRSFLGLASALFVFVALAAGLWWALAHQGEPAKAVADGPSSTNGNQTVQNQAASEVATPAAPADVKPSSALLSPTAPEAPRTILEDLYDEMASISSDGRLLAKLDRDAQRRLTGDVAIQDLSDRSVTPLGLAHDGEAEQPAISRNGRRVAYRWTPSDGGLAQLGVVEFPRISGTQPKYFKDDDPGTSVEYVHDWSPDGRRVLVTLAATKSRERRLAWVSTDDPHIEILKTFDPRTFKLQHPARVSATGQIAYSAKVVAEGGSNQNDYIYVLTKDGVNEQVVGTAASSRYPLWWPDGTKLVYTSDQFGNTDLWSVPIRDGKAGGLREVMRPNIGPGTAIGLADNGSYFYRSFEPGLEQIFIAALADNPNPRAETLVFTTVFEGLRPSWSPDGQSIAFYRRHPEGFSVVVGPIHNGNEHVVQRNTSSVAEFRALPLLWLDPQSVLRQYIAQPQRPELRRIDVSRIDRVTNLGPVPQPGVWRAWASALASGGKILYSCARITEQGPWDRLVAIEVATGMIKWEFPLPDGLRSQNPGPLSVGLALSPEGEQLAVAILLDDGKARLFVVGVNGQGYRPLYSPYSTQGTLGRLAWTTNGIYLSEVVSVDTPQGAKMRSRVMRLPPEEGVAQVVLETNGSDFEASFDASPDGLLIAVQPNRSAKQPFSANAGARSTLWVMNLKALEARAGR